MPRSVKPGDVVRYSAEQNPAYLWELRAPMRFLTTEVDAELQVLDISDTGIRAALRARKRASQSQWWDWSYHGRDRYVFSPVPPPEERHTF
ncbi:MAG TPA: hypothetical protein VF219_17050 [Vicinamibacterales bacterium]